MRWARRFSAVTLGLCVAALALWGGGCSDEPKGTLLVTGSVSLSDDPADAMAGAGVWHRGARVYDATVTVNGEPLELLGTYDYGASELPIAPGDLAVLSVSWGSLGVTADVIMPEKPVVTAPTAAAGPYDASADITVTWAALSPAPDEVQIHVPDAFTSSGEYWSATVDGTETSAIIPAGMLKAGASVSMAVAAVNRTVVEGRCAEPGSAFSASAWSFAEDFATQP